MTVDSYYFTISKIITMKENDPIHTDLNPSLKNSFGKLGEPGGRETIVMKTKEGSKIVELGLHRPIPVETVKPIKKVTTS